PGDRRFHDNAVVARSQRRWRAAVPLGFDVSLNPGFNQIVALLRYLSNRMPFHLGPRRDCHVGAGMFSGAGTAVIILRRFLVAFQLRKITHAVEGERIGWMKLVGLLEI